MNIRLVKKGKESEEEGFVGTEAGDIVYSRRRRRPSYPLYLFCFSCSLYTPSVLLCTLRFFFLIQSLTYPKEKAMILQNNKAISDVSL